ncbi:MAG TPA: amidase family protein [Stellaceae bacterium]|jgi:Asp-tRNA(Asn)/Glu-tRNA(Gln) amidotransferase A subunit family amidase|nr:amidase family protein [Stellaceae bacterium]
MADKFTLLEASIADIHAAYRGGTLTVRQVVQAYLDRIAAYDQSGPKINALISLNPRALDEADRLDAAFRAAGFVGPLHGIPVVLKDQADVAEMPTTLGSVLFKDHWPRRDCFVAAKLKQAGAIFIAKGTLGELGAGDTHGSLFGSTRNPYDLARTVGGSSGGPAAAVSANFATVAIGQEGLASIRRPAIWTAIAGMRPSIGLVSRTGVYGGWPTTNGSLGPMARSVADLAKLLDAMVGYDPEDPVTAHGVGRAPASYAALLDRDALRGARIGVLREPMGLNSDPSAADFIVTTNLFDQAIGELRDCGAAIVDPVVIPDLKALLAKRTFGTPEADQSITLYLAGGANPPFRSREEAMASPLFQQLLKPTRDRWQRPTAPGPATTERQLASLKARDTLMTNMLAVMADNRLDAIVHKAVEHLPTLIADGVNPPFTEQKGAPHINTYLETVPSVAVPAAFTADGLPTGITFLGRPYADTEMLRFAYAYEQATHHRRAPPAMP